MLRLLVVATLCLSIAPTARAAEFHVVTGGFNVTAASSSRSGSVSNLGAYHLAYERRIVSGVEFVAGYTVLVSGFLSGDLAYGLDLGVNYYPFTDSEPFVFEDQAHSVQIVDLWRPYVGAYFSQRQFQSVQTGYAGAGFALGVERALGTNYSIKALVRHIFFSGSGASAQETALLAGLSIAF